MKKNNLVKFVITPEMIDEAKEEAIDRMSKWGMKTRAVISDRDVVGSLAHQGVENILKYWDVEHKSYRKVEYEQGDFADIKLRSEYLDVKGTRKNFNPKYFYNEDFLVFSDQLEKEQKTVQQFVFVGLQRDFSYGYIYGIIDVPTFMELSTDVRLKYDNKCIKSHQLKPFKEYVFEL